MAVTPFVSDIEMNKNVIYNPCFHISFEDIRNPKDGQYYLNSEDDKVYFYRTTDNQWHKLGDNSIIYTEGRGIHIDNENVISVRDKIFDDIENNSSRITEIDTEIEQIHTDTEDLDLRIRQNKTSITSLEETMSLTVSRVASLEDNVVDIYNQLSTANEKISANAQRIQTNTANINDIMTKIADDETDIADNAREILGLKTRVTTNETDISTLKSGLNTTNENVRNLQNNKLDKNFTSEIVTDTQLNSTDASVKLKQTKLNPATGATASSETSIPIVNSEHVGLATSIMFDTIADNTRRIDSLEQQGGHYIGRSFATYSELSQYEIPTSLNIGDFTFVIDDETHQEATARYILSTNNDGNREFIFAYVIEYDPIGQFTNESLGLVKGSNKDGYVSAQADGTGSINGWNELKTEVSQNKSNITTLTSRVDSIENNELDPIREGIEKVQEDITDALAEMERIDTTKADKDKLQSVVSDIDLEITADRTGKRRNFNITETTYDVLHDTSTTTKIPIPLATETSAGLLDPDDQVKLNNLSEGAEVNQNAYSNIRVGQNSLTASTKTDSFELKAGDGIKLNVEPSTKTIEIENSAAVVEKLATWTEKGLQSPYDKEREDKMGEEIWEATVDTNGNYEIDIKDFTGYMGEHSHIFVKFMKGNTIKSPTLRIYSSTGDYSVVDPAPIIKFGSDTLERNFLVDESIWELIYSDDGKFYIVASSGALSSRDGYNDKELQEGESKVLATGELEANQRVAIMMEITAFANNSKTATGILEIQLKSNENNLNDSNNTFLRWINKSGEFETSARSNGTAVTNNDYSALKNEDFSINISNGNSFIWKLIAEPHTEGTILQYKVLNLTDEEGNEPSIDVLTNVNESVGGLKFRSTYDKVVSPEDPNYQVKSMIRIHRDEFDELLRNGNIIPGMLYNVVDDQIMTRLTYVVEDYNDFDPTIFDMQPGEIIGIRAEMNSSFHDVEVASSGIMIAGNSTYTLICEGEGKDALYRRAFINGEWEDWQIIAGATDLDKYIKSSDSSIKDIVTKTQSEYDQLVIDGEVDENTLYNVVRDDGSSVVARVLEYTSLAQLGISPALNLDPMIILDAMSDNSILYMTLDPETLTLQELDSDDATIEFVKIDDEHFYVRVTEKKDKENRKSYYIRNTSGGGRRWRRFL